MHTMPPTHIDPINRAMVVGCAVSAHAQPFEITRAEKIKSTLLQHSRQNAKVVEAFCHAACRRFEPMPPINSPTAR